MAHEIVNGKPLMDKENQEHQQQETTPPSQEQARRGPVPGGYGFERVRLRIEPELPGERRPTQAVIASEERAEVHAILG